MTACSAYPHLQLTALWHDVSKKKKRLNDDEDWKSLNFTYHQSSPQPFQGVGMSAGSGEMFAGGACKLALFIAEGSSAGLGT